MTAPDTAHCWYCYRPSTRTTGVCDTCGQQIAPPAGTTAVDLELWALSHPDPARLRRAVDQLAAHRDPRATRPLRALLNDDGTDPSLAVAAMRALVSIGGLETCAATLSHLALTGAPPVRAAAFELLHG